jgi:hypothetical protein
VNCDVLISDRPEHGEYCSANCKKKYIAEATSLIAAALTLYEAKREAKK